MVRVGMACHRYHRKNEVTWAKTESNANVDTSGSNATSSSSNAVILQRAQPHTFIWLRLEHLIERMQAEEGGLHVGTVKNCLTTVPSVFTGTELINWLTQHMDIEEPLEAIHLACMLAAYGYILPADDHLPVVKNDGGYYRFQTPCMWPSRQAEADNTDYAVFLCKRTMQNKQRLELADYEAENLARLQRILSYKWEFIYIQAEAEAKVDKKRDKLERLVLESQERCFWDVHRPAPGVVSSIETDMRKLCRAKRPKKIHLRPPTLPIPSGRVSPPLQHGDSAPLPSMPSTTSIEQQEQLIEQLRQAVARRRVKVSKVVENMISYYEQYSEFDPFVSGLATDSSSEGNNLASAPSIPIFSGGPLNDGAASGNALNSVGFGFANPWISDSLEFWDEERRLRDLPLRRVKRWAFSIHELLRDPAGHEEFERWLEREFSRENLVFWEACQDLRKMAAREVSAQVQRLYEDYLSPEAEQALNVDCKVSAAVRRRIQEAQSGNNNSNSCQYPADRYIFLEAEEHIFQLMKNDSYLRFLRSDLYKELQAGTKKKSKKRFPSDVRRNLTDVE